MFGTVRTATPVHVRVDRASDAGLLWMVFEAIGAALVAVLLTCWRAPVLVVLAALIAGGAWAGLAGHASAAAAGLVAVVAVALGLAWVRPSWGRRVLDHLLGEALRVLVYRPRWETACLTAHATTRAGSQVLVPGLGKR